MKNVVVLCQIIFYIYNIKTPWNLLQGNQHCRVGGNKSKHLTSHLHFPTTLSFWWFLFYHSHLFIIVINI